MLLRALAYVEAKSGNARRREEEDMVKIGDTKIRHVGGAMNHNRDVNAARAMEEKGR